MLKNVISVHKIQKTGSTIKNYILQRAQGLTATHKNNNEIIF